MSAAQAGYAAVAGLLGLILGSFANVCIHRIPAGESVIAPRSRCPSCGGAIRWHDNIPVVSWFLLGARCRDCGSRISGVYPAVEALMGAGFVAAYVRFGAGLDGLAAAWLFFACVVLAVIDMKQFLLPDLLTLTGLAAGHAFALARGIVRAVEGPSGGEGWAWLGGILDAPVLPLASIAGAAAGAAIPLAARGGWMLLRRLRAGRVEAEAIPGGEEAGGPEAEVREAALAEGMGLGDVKMLAMVGAFLGARMALVTILLGSILGCIVVLPYLAARGRGLRTPIPFGPFLAAGAVAALFAGEELVTAYADLVRRLAG